MSFDEKILSRVLAGYEQKRLRRENDLLRKREEVYRLVPRIADIDSALKTASLDIISASLKSGSNPLPMLESIQSYNRNLNSERTSLLKSHGFSPDYLTPACDCPICGDSGFLADGPCVCIVEAYSLEQTKELSRLLPIENQTFDTFSLNLYSNEVDGEWGMSPRDNMSAVLDTCKEFAAYFGSQSHNLLLCGGVGLGKTFLSSCIAGEVSRRGYSVIYDTAINVFSFYEKEKFNRGAEYIEDIEREIERFHSCDLFILDDLGTEMPTPFINTALYSLINTRLMRGKKTIINTNLSEDADLPRRYSPQIISRLRGEYLILPFFGEDIRVKKNIW
jgi:DNA replication protein DnaC